MECHYERDVCKSADRTPKSANKVTSFHCLCCVWVFFSLFYCPEACLQNLAINQREVILLKRCPCTKFMGQAEVEREAPAPAVGPSDGASASLQCPLFIFHGVATQLVAFVRASRQRHLEVRRLGSVGDDSVALKHFSRGRLAFIKPKLKTKLKGLRVYWPDFS